MKEARFPHRTERERRSHLSYLICCAFVGLLLLLSACSYAPSSSPLLQVAAQRIKHIVFFIKENRTFDNYFGTYPGANGATTAVDSEGETIPLLRGQDQVLDIDTSFEGARDAYDDGKMDQFDLLSSGATTYKTRQGNPYANNSLTQMYQSDIPNYWLYARNFVLGDNMFSSVMGPSFPNQLYLIAAQSAGVIDDPPASTVGWGCDVANEQVKVMSSDGLSSLQNACFDFQTLADELDAQGDSWRYYAPPVSDGGFGYHWSAFDAIKHIRYGSDWQYVVPTLQFMKDAANGSLPTVSWVVAPDWASERPPASVCQGENWTVNMLNKLMRGPDWSSTAVFLTWGNSGGFYDHVPPPQLDDAGLGFRVPLLIISPYAKKGYIDHTLYDYSSMLRFAEDILGLPALAKRDKGANDMLNAFNFSQKPATPLILRPRVCP